MERKYSEETKKMYSERMKKRHKEGTAWNIGKSRWNNKPSYPEKFFKQIIEERFSDKEYKNEFPIGIYSFDFAWPHLMKAIEIDGQQHEKPEYQERDQRKNLKAFTEGWQILRISWKEMYRNTKLWIEIANNFIHDENFILENWTIPEKEIIGKNSKIPFNYFENLIKIQKIKDSNIEFSKYGWTKEASIILEITSQKTSNWMKRNMFDFWNEHCFKRTPVNFFTR